MGRGEESVGHRGEGLSEQGVGYDVDEEKAHRHRVLVVKAIEDRLSKRERLKRYEVCGSYLNHSQGDVIREHLGMPKGYDIALPQAVD